MASYHCTVKVGSRGTGGKHADYVQRSGAYQNYKGGEELAHTESINMPGWAAHDPSEFFRQADLHERANGSAYREIEVAIPRELSKEQRVEFIREFVAQEIGADHPCTWAIHQPKSALTSTEQPHAHIMFSERKLDGIERNPEQFFKRAAAAYKHRTTKEMVQPDAAAKAKGGCPKSDKFAGSPTERKEKLVALRERFASLQNKHLEKHGHADRVTHKSLEAQGIDRLPEKHLGPVAARIEENIVAILRHRGAARQLERAEEDVGNINLSSSINEAFKKALALKEKQNALSNRNEQARQVPPPHLRNRVLDLSSRDMVLNGGRDELPLRQDVHAGLDRPAEKQNPDVLSPGRRVEPVRPVEPVAPAPARSVVSQTPTPAPVADWVKDAVDSLKRNLDLKAAQQPQAAREPVAPTIPPPARQNAPVAPPARPTEPVYHPRTPEPVAPAPAPAREQTLEELLAEMKRAQQPAAPARSTVSQTPTPAPAPRAPARPAPASVQQDRYAGLSARERVAAMDADAAKAKIFQENRARHLATPPVAAQASREQSVPKAREARAVAVELQNPMEGLQPTTERERELVQRIGEAIKTNNPKELLACKDVLASVKREAAHALAAVEPQAVNRVAIEHQVKTRQNEEARRGLHPEPWYMSGVGSKTGACAWDRVTEDKAKAHADHAATDRPTGWFKAKEGAAWDAKAADLKKDATDWRDATAALRHDLKSTVEQLVAKESQSTASQNARNAPERERQLGRHEFTRELEKRLDKALEPTMEKERQRERGRDNDYGR